MIKTVDQPSTALVHIVHQNDWLLVAPPAGTTAPITAIEPQPSTAPITAPKSATKDLVQHFRADIRILVLGACPGLPAGLEHDGLQLRMNGC